MTVPVPCTVRDDAPPRSLGGLLALVERKEVALPLKAVKVRARVAGTCAHIVVEQRFANPRTTPVEAVYVFPLSPAAAVVGMELRCGELVVTGDLRRREEAEATFREAREAGHRAALLTSERADVHTLRVTRLPPGEEVVVRVELVEALEMVDGRLRFRFPTTIPPRYMPGDAKGHAGPGVAADTDLVPDASRISPPVRLSGGTPLDLEVRLEGAVRSLESSLHAVRLDLADGVRVAPSGTATLDRDFVLAFAFGEADRPAARGWTDGRATLVVVEPPVLAAAAAMPRDAVFVVDISGSMEGAKMDAAKRALSTALHGLLPGDRFRLVAFDDRVESFAEGWTTYDDPSLARADKWVAKLDARGGTEMLPALEAAFAGDTPAGRLRTVLFVTDGQAGDEDRLVAAVHGRRGAARLFTLGIDTAVNASLLGRLARIGGGACELCTPQDDIEATVARIEARFGAPLLDGLTVDGGEAADPAPATLFGGRPATLLVTGAPATVKVSGRSAAGPWSAEATVTRTDAPVYALWARARVAMLEDRVATRPWEEEAVRGEITRVGLEARIATRTTAWVAVERTRKVDGTLAEVVQPVELASGWDPRFRGQVDAMMVASPTPSFGGAPTGTGMPMRSRAPAPAPSMAPMASMGPGAPPTGGAKAKKSSLVSRMMDTFRGPPPEMEAPADADDTAFFDVAPSAKEAQEVITPMESVRRGPPPRTIAPTADPAAALAASQSADGSFGGDVGRTAAALLVLVLLGHTRRAGIRQRTVGKAATWLQAHTSDPRAAAALAALEAAERGEKPVEAPTWVALRAAGPEGKWLQGLV